MNATRHVLTGTLSPEAKAENRKSIEDFLGSGRSSDPLWADMQINYAYKTGNFSLFYERIKELMSYNSIPRAQAQALPLETIEKTKAAMALSYRHQPLPASR